MREELKEAGHPTVDEIECEMDLVIAYNVWCNPSNSYKNIEDSRNLGINRSRIQGAGKGKFKSHPRQKS